MKVCPDLCTSGDVLTVIFFGKEESLVVCFSGNFQKLHKRVIFVQKDNFSPFNTYNVRLFLNTVSHLIRVAFSSFAFDSGYRTVGVDMYNGSLESEGECGFKGPLQRLFFQKAA